MSSSLQDRLSEHPGTIIKNQYGGGGGGLQRHNKPRFILGYWSTRCLGAPLRMLLSAAQIDHWVLLYDVHDLAKDSGDVDSGWDKSCWLKDKEWLKEEYPLINLPFLVDCANDGCVISQTNAITTYLGRELELVGTTKEEMSKCEELLCEINDLRDLMISFAYKTDQGTCQQDAKLVIEEANRHFERLELHFRKEYPDAKDRRIERDDLNTIGFAMRSVVHLVGNAFSAPDFHLWEMLDQFEGLCRRFGLPNCLGTATTYSDQVDQLKLWETPTAVKKQKIYPYLKEFHDNFLALPANHVYGTMYGLNNAVTDRDALRLPYNNSYARFGSCPDPEKVYVRGQVAPWRNRGVITKTYTRIETGIEYGDDEAVAESRRLLRDGDGSCS